MKTVVGLMNNRDEAENVVQDLVNSGFRRDTISIMASDEEPTGLQGEEDRGEVEARTKGAVKGVEVGAAVGGIAGLVVGLTGLAAIPGIGPVIAAGPIVALLSGAGMGAVAGGAIGALTKMGVTEEDARYYAEGVRRGGFLVTVAADDDSAEKAADIMRLHGAIDLDKQAESWREEGWFEKTEPAFDDDEFQRHFSSTYGPEGERFETYRSAYHYAEAKSSDPQLRGKEWPEVEEDIHRDWERSHPEPWTKVKEAIHYGWDRTRRH